VQRRGSQGLAESDVVNQPLPGDGNGYGYGNGNGDGDGYGDGNGYGSGNGNGDGDGYGDGDGDGDGDGYGSGNGNGYGYGDGDGYGSGFNKESDGPGILSEIGVPPELHKFFLPLSEESMLNAASYACADTGDAQDRVIGILEYCRGD